MEQSRDGRPSREPKALRRGKRFHREMQASWKTRHGGDGSHSEYRLASPRDGRAGRMDVLVDIEEAVPERGDTSPFKAVLELKDRDFDHMKPRSLRSLIGRDRRQVLRYVDSLVDLSSSAEAHPDESYVMAAIAYRRSPSDPGTKAMIEAFFDEEFIIVIWEDETVAEAKRRLG